MPSVITEPTTFNIICCAYPLCSAERENELSLNLLTLPLPSGTLYRMVKGRYERQRGYLPPPHSLTFKPSFHQHKRERPLKGTFIRASLLICDTLAVWQRSSGMCSLRYSVSKERRCLCGGGQTKTAHTFISQRRQEDQQRRLCLWTSSIFFFWPPLNLFLHGKTQF